MKEVIKNLATSVLKMEKARSEINHSSNNLGTFNNPHNICTWNENSACASCGIEGELHCKWDRNILSGFYAISVPAGIMACLGIVYSSFITGAWWPLIAYIVYFLVMFNVFEIRFLCSHCPYYAEDSKILHCLANQGSFKFWHYHPEPLNRFEQFMMYGLISTIFFIFPLAITGYCGR